MKKKKNEIIISKIESYIIVVSVLAAVRPRSHSGREETSLLHNNELKILYPSLRF